MKKIAAVLALLWACMAGMVQAADINTGQGRYDYGQGRGMGAGVAAVADHSAIEMNPAGITQLPRYSIGALFYHQGNGAAFGFSLLDNKTSPIAMGVDYRNARPIEGKGTDFESKVRHKLNIAVGEYYENKVHVGFGYQFRREVKLVRGKVTQPTADSNHNFYTGAVIPVNKRLRIGVASYNLLWFTKNGPDPVVSSGVAVAAHERILLVADVIQVTDNIRHWQAALGAEILAMEEIALRAGWQQDYFKKTGRPMIWSAGFGWYFPKGQFSYAFNTEPEPGPGDRTRHSIAIEINVK